MTFRSAQRQNCFGMRQSPDARPPSIAIFEKLFALRPELKVLTPVTFIRQPTARRVIRKGSRQHNVGFYASRLNNALVPYESTLELQACALLESQPEVIAYRTQPYQIRLSIAGKLRVVYPDLQILTATGIALADIKFLQSTRKQAFHARNEALHDYARQRGIGYTVLTEAEIRVPRMKTAQWLTSLARGKARPQLHEAVWQWLSSLDQSTFGEAFGMAIGYPAVRSVLAELALDGHLDLDWDRPICDQRVQILFEQA